MNTREWWGLWLNWRVYGLPTGNRIHILKNATLAKQKLSVSS